MNQFLIPANSKRGQLIFSVFEKIDLIIEIIGVSITIILFLIVRPQTLLPSMLVLLPGLISTFLVLPIPNYHNVRCVIKNIYEFYFGSEKNELVWKGWCVKDEYKD